MFISNIIYKLSAIIYKPRIIYKATTAPTNKDQQSLSTNINTGSIKPLYTTFDHTLSTRQQAYAPFSLAHTSLTLAYTCFTFLTRILT